MNMTDGRLARLCAWCLACLLAAWSLSDVGEARLHVVRDGKPMSEIAVGPKPSPVERFAAEEVKRYVERISGAALPILGQRSRGAAILVGKPRGVPERVRDASGGVACARSLRVGCGDVAGLGKQQSLETVAHRGHGASGGMRQVRCVV